VAGEEIQPFEELIDGMKKGAGVLKDADVPFLVGGGIAVWARGGPETGHDVDFFLKPSDAEQALEAFEAAGWKTEKPPEGWLYKAFDDQGAMIDLIFSPSAGDITDETFERAEELEVNAVRMQVASLEDVMVTKLLALTEQEPDFDSVLEATRAVREQVDWDDVRARTSESALAKGFFTMVEELGVVPESAQKKN
jgi:predicted nucleotidyltransferase